MSADDSRPDPVPVDTLDPIEPAVRHPSTFRSWALMLGGPVLWILHFGIVYLAAEAACTADGAPGLRFVGPGALELLVAAVTVVLAVGAGAVGVAAHRAVDLTEVTERVAVSLAIGSAVAILAVGLPVLVLAPC